MKSEYHTPPIQTLINTLRWRSDLSNQLFSVSMLNLNSDHKIEKKWVTLYE